MLRRDIATVAMVVETTKCADYRDQISLRDISFDLARGDVCNWHSAGSGVSRFYNAMSLFFPKGEKFFINSVREHRKHVKEERLLSDVSGFMQQEAAHSREHRAYIGAMVASGYEVDTLDIRMFSKPLEKVAPRRRLAMTVAMEHFTASLAHQILSSGAIMRGDSEFGALWRWHAVEEIEHKSVAFDVFTSAYGRGVGAYFLRCSAAIQVTMGFMRRLFVNVARLAEQDGASWRSWLALLRYLWVAPGLFRRMTPAFFVYFHPKFHPSNTDDRRLIAAWRDAAASSASREWGGCS